MFDIEKKVKGNGKKSIKSEEMKWFLGYLIRKNEKKKVKYVYKMA